MSLLSGYESPTDIVNASGQYDISLVDSRRYLTRLNCRGPPLKTSARQSLVLLEAEETDGSDGSDSAGSDDEDARNPLPALNTVTQCEDDEHKMELVSVGR